MLAPTGQGEGVLLKHLVPKCVIANQLLSRGEKDTRKGGREPWTELVGWGQRRKDARQGVAGPRRARATRSSWGQWAGAQPPLPCVLCPHLPSATSLSPLRRCLQGLRGPSARLGSHAVRHGRLVLPLPSREQRDLHQFSGAGQPLWGPLPLPTVKGWAPRKVWRRTGRRPPEMELERAGPEEVGGPERGCGGPAEAVQPQEALS